MPLSGWGGLPLDLTAANEALEPIWTLRMLYATIGSMTVVKLSVSIDDQLFSFLEGYQKEYPTKSKSEIISDALRLLRQKSLESQYKAALEEWQEDAEAWEVVVGDGLENLA